MEGGGARGCPPGGEAATAQASMETDTHPNKTHHPEASGSSPPTFTSGGRSPLPIARLSPPPSTPGHVPLAARATQGPVLNLWPAGAKLEAGTARAARVPGGQEREREPGPATSAGRTMTCYRGFLLRSCRRVAGGRAAALRGPGAGGPAVRPRLGGDGGGRRHLGQGQSRELAGCGSRPDGGFRPSRVVVVAKTTRYEFEQQRYRYAELSEEDLKQLVGLGGLAVVFGLGPAAGRPSLLRRPRCSARPARRPLLALVSLVGPPPTPLCVRERENEEGGGL